MAEEQKYMMDIGTIFHNLFFAYQKSMKNILQSGAEIFVDPTINILHKIEEEDNLKLVNSNSLEDALQNFADFLVKSKAVGSCTYKKLGEDKYVFKVEDCIWANYIHKMLEPKDVVCPYGLVAMSLYKKFKGCTINNRESTYYSNGTETVLEPLET